LAFRALVSSTEIEELLRDPDMWHPLRSGQLGARWGVRFLRRQYELLAGLAGEDAVLVSSQALLPARLVQEKLGRPLASMVLQPRMIASGRPPAGVPAHVALA